VAGKLGARAAAASLLCVALAALAGCDGTSRSGASPDSGPPPTARVASPSPTTTPLAAAAPTWALLRAADLPAGYRNEPLTGRNLPSALSGCAPLSAAWASLGPYAQVELTPGPRGPYLDQAVIDQGDATRADTLVRSVVGALAGCGRVTVTEEGFAVPLTVTPIGWPTYGDASHAYRASGSYAGVPLGMRVLLVRQGQLVTILMETGVSLRIDGTTLRNAADVVVARVNGHQR
jgi:hypothetical protein